ncbi:MAG: flagellar protein FliS [Lachnospiraceae bacterium]|nr:flagellar protein FliS [Lachnospiraceae bacterium]
MTEEQKQAYTRRITQANKTQLVTILYEMTSDYMKDAAAAAAKGDGPETDRQIQLAQGCVDQLIHGLDMRIEISNNLLQLYLYAKQELIKAVTDHDPKHFDNAGIVINGLHETYLKLEQMDSSEPVMENTQSVVAGMTYGQNGLNEALANPDANRGFKA